MRVLRVSCEVDSRPWLALEPPRGDFLAFFNGEKRADGWSCPGLAIDGSGDQPADFMEVNFAPFPAVNARAKSFLDLVLGEWVEFLPLEGVGEERWLAHVLLVSDCLDEQQTDFRSSGVPFRYAFHEAVLGRLQVPLFQLSYLRGAGLFATETFGAAYNQSGLAGLVLAPLNQIT